MFRGPSGGPKFSELNCSESPNTDLGWTNSLIPNANKNPPTHACAHLTCCQADRRTDCITPPPKKHFPNQGSRKRVNPSISRAELFFHVHSSAPYIVQVRKSKVPMLDFRQHTKRRFSLLSLFWKNKSRLMRSRYCPCVCVSPLSLLDNVSVKVLLSLLGNGSVKILLLLLGNGSVQLPLSLLGNG
jgi:hypothetical protein